MAQMVKNPPAMKETWVQSLDWEDPLEKEMATHSSMLGWGNPMERGACQATVHAAAKSQTLLSDFTFSAFPLDFVFQYVWLQASDHIIMII